MKVLFSIITILLLASHSVFGQVSHIRYSEGNADGEASIIRNWMGCSLRYYHGSGSGIIALAGHNPTTVDKIPLAPGMAVEDMRVLNNDLYFCGSYQQSAFIGRIDLHSLWAGNPTQGIFYTVFSDDVYSLRRMVVFNDGNSIHVIALGSSSPSPAIADHLILECTYQNNLIGNAEIIFPGRFNYREIVDEVILTDNHVAFVGHLIDSNGVVIHPCPRSSSVLASFGQCSYYSYPDAVTISPFIGTCLSADSIAVASCVGILSNSATEIRLHSFDLTSMAMLSHQSVAIGEEKLIPQELIYFPEQESLILLTPYPFAGSTNMFSTFFYLHPFASSSYNVPGMYNPRIKYQSIDKVFSNFFFAAGGDKWFLHQLAPTFVPANCYRVDEAVATLKSLIEPTPLAHFHMTRSTQKSSIGELCPIENNIFSIDCVQN